MGKVHEIASKLTGAQPQAKPGRTPAEMLEQCILDRASEQLAVLQGEQKDRIEDTLKAIKAGMGILAHEMKIIERNHHNGMMIAIERAEKKFRENIDRALQEGAFGDMKAADQIAEKYSSRIAPPAQPVAHAPGPYQTPETTLIGRELKKAEAAPDEVGDVPAFLKRKASG